MTSDASHPDPLLEHAGFLGRLARRLVRDEHDREDLLQEAWASALAARGGASSGASEPLRNPRAWLARILRSRAANLLRDESRREDRERAGAKREDELADGEDVGRDLAVQERVLAAVSQLREPYRTAIYLRYYRELTPSAMAAQLGLPQKTVDSRLLRGRALLREQLTREFGDRSTWILGLLPLCPPNLLPAPLPLPVAQAGSILSVGAMGMKLKLALCAVAATVVVAATFQLTRADERGGRERGLEREPEALALVAPEVRPPAAALERSERIEAEVLPTDPRGAQVATPPAAVEALAPVGSVLRGLVVDPEGRPVPAAQLEYGPFGQPGDGANEQLARSDFGGRFEFTGLAGHGRVRVAEPGWTTVIEGALRYDATAGEVRETTVVAAPSHVLTVEVVDEAGAPVPEARLSVKVPPAVGANLEHAFEDSVEVRIEARTDAAGGATVTVPVVPGLALEVRKDGYERLGHTLAAADFSGSDLSELTLTLVHLRASERTLSGRVVDAAGDGLAGALVEFAYLGVRTDEAGRFHFDLTRGDPLEREPGKRLPARLTAAFTGLLPVTLEAAEGSDGQPLWPDEIVLQLADAPLSIAGRVVDLDGRALPGAVVFLPRTHLVGGRTTLEAELRGWDEDGEFTVSERAGSDGRFEFGGLLDEPYDVAAYLEGSLLRGQLEAVPAGATGIELRIDTRNFWPEVHGRVEDRRGRGLAGVQVTPRMWTQSAVGPSGDWNASEDLPPAVTEADGSFVLRNVPRAHVLAVLEHPELLYAHNLEFPSAKAVEDEHGNLRGCVLIGPLRLRFQVVLDDPEEADEFRLLDAEGVELPTFKQSANNYNSSDAYFRLEAGRSRHLFIGESAVQLVLRKGGEEVRRAPISLRWLEESLLK